MITTSATAAMRIRLAMSPPPAAPLIASRTRLIPSDTQRSMRSMIDGPGRWNSARERTSCAADRASAPVCAGGGRSSQSTSGGDALEAIVDRELEVEALEPDAQIDVAEHRRESDDR